MKITISRNLVEKESCNSGLALFDSFRKEMDQDGEDLTIEWDALSQIWSLCDQKICGWVRWALNNKILPSWSFQGEDLTNADLRGADLIEADLNGADLRGADLRYANLKDADLNGADLTGAYYPKGYLPEGWIRSEKGFLLKRLDLTGR